MGLKGLDLTPLIEYANKVDVPYKIIKTDIAEIIFEMKKER